MPKHLALADVLGSTDHGEWSLGAYTKLLHRVCRALDNNESKARTWYKERLAVETNWENEYSILIKGSSSGVIYQSWRVRGSQHHWPIDLLSARLQLSLNGLSAASLEDLAVYNVLIDLE
jgi:hypothetical protein